MSAVWFAAVTALHCALASQEGTLRSVLCAALSWPSQILMTSTDVRVLCCANVRPVLDPQASKCQGELDVVGA
jgi:hypothetical protein